MMIDIRLYQLVRDFIDDRIALDEFEKKYIPLLPALLSIPNSDNADLVAEVELNLVDYNNGTIDDLKSEMEVAISKYNTFYMKADVSAPPNDAP